MTHWRGPFYEDLGQPHVNIGQCSQEHGDSWSCPVQVQELDSIFLVGPFQLRVFHDLVILWILKSLLSVLAGLQLAHGWGHQDRGVWIWTQIPPVSYSHIPLSRTAIHSPGILVGDRQAEQEVVFCPKDALPAHSWVSDLSQSISELDLEVMTWLSCVCGCCLFCVFSLQFFNSSKSKSLWQKSTDLKGSQGLYFYKIQNQQDTSLRGNKLH